MGCWSCNEKMMSLDVISCGFYYGVERKGTVTYYKPIGNDGSWVTYGTPQKKDIHEFIRFDSSTGKIGCPFFWRSKSDMDYRFIKDTSITIKSDFQQFIEYQGKNGSLLKCTYKESSGDLARPAFTTEFVFDLNEDSTLVYKNAIINIIEAKGSSITYKVIKNFK